MKISIFGLGYVGCVTAGCFLEQGHKVVGVDIVKEKVEAINNGNLPIYEPGLDQLIQKHKSNLSATNDAEEAIKKTDISIICVGTPSKSDGEVDISYLKNTLSRISKIFKTKSNHYLFIRSTSPPGTSDRLIKSIFKDSKIFSRILYYPEFLREGIAIKDFFNPSLNVVGIDNTFNKNKAKSLLKKLNPDIKTPLHIVRIKTAESIKYANNSYHALKIVFANELAQVFKEYGVNAAEVMELFCSDKRLNISPYYFKPGFAYGGSCLPKELSAIVSLAKNRNVSPVLFESIIESNNNLILKLISKIYSFSPNSVGFFGITFKPNTDDTRESPVLKTIDLLTSKSRSYSKEIINYIFDSAEALERIKSRVDDNFKIVNSEKELINKSDIIILGTYKINSTIEKNIISSGKPVINLKWFEYSKKLHEYKKYYTLV